MINDPEIVIDYTITFPEFVSGSKLGWRQSIFTLVFYVLARYVATALAVLSSILVISSFSSGLHEAAWRLLPVPLLLFSIPLILTFNWRAAYRRLKMPGSDAPQLSFAANGQEFVRKIHGMGELTWLWSATQGFAQNKKAVVIVTRKGAFIIIPRRALTETQVERLQAMQKGTA